MSTVILEEIVAKNESMFLRLREMADDTLTVLNIAVKQVEDEQTKSWIIGKIQRWSRLKSLAARPLYEGEQTDANEKAVTLKRRFDELSAVFEGDEGD